MEQNFDLQITLRCLGVPFRNKSHIFGDSKSVVDSIINPHSKTHNRYVALSFNRARETAVVGIISCYFTQRSLSIADLLRKCWIRDNVCHVIQPLMFWQGDNEELFEEE